MYLFLYLFELCCLRLVMLALQKNVAYSLKYTWEPILKTLTFKCKHFSIHIVIKSCRTENNNYLVGGLQEHCDQTYMDSCKNSTKMFAATSHTRSLFSIKDIWILTWVRWVFGTLVHYLLSLLAFQIKSLFLAPTTRLSIYWPVVQWAVRVWTR